MDLAFDLARIHGPSAVVHGHDARDPDNPCLGIDRYLGELHTAEIFACEAHRAGDAEAAIIVTAVGNCADEILVQATGRLPKLDAVRRVGAKENPSLADNEFLRRCVQFRSHCREQSLPNLIGGLARGRRDRPCGLAASGTWT